MHSKRAVKHFMGCNSSTVTLRGCQIVVQMDTSRQLINVTRSLLCCVPGIVCVKKPLCRKSRLRTMKDAWLAHRLYGNVQKSLTGLLGKSAVEGHCFISMVVAKACKQSIERTSEAKEIGKMVAERLSCKLPQCQPGASGPLGNESHAGIP